MGHVQDSPLLRSAINEVAHLFHKGARLLPGGFREPPLDFARLPPAARALVAGARAEQLAEKYRLAPMQGWMLYLGTLFLVDLFDRLFEASPEYFEYLPKSSRVLDVGAHDFESAPGLYFALRGLGLEPELTGIEIGAGRAAKAAARARIAMLPGRHRYLTADVLGHRERYQLISWIHPFLDEQRLLEWGLPRRLLRPRAMLEHVLGLLSPRGVLVIVNQERSEQAAQRALLEALGARFRTLDVPVHFRSRDQPAHVFLAAPLI